MAYGGAPSNAYALFRRETFVRRCKTELDVIDRSAVIHGAKFTGIGQFELDGRKMLKFTWSLWRFDVNMEMILTDDFPESPPMIRVTDMTGQPIQHQHIDADGIVHLFVGVSAAAWNPDKTSFQDVCAMIMRLFRESIATPMPTLGYVLGANYRHKIKITPKEFEFLVSPFGGEYLKKLALVSLKNPALPRVPLRFETMGGKSRAKTGAYELVIKSAVELDFAPIETEIREYLKMVLPNETNARSTRNPPEPVVTKEQLMQLLEEILPPIDEEARDTSAKDKTKEPNQTDMRGVAEVGRDRGRTTTSQRTQMAPAMAPAPPAIAALPQPTGGSDVAEQPPPIAAEIIFARGLCDQFNDATERIFAQLEQRLNILSLRLQPWEDAVDYLRDLRNERQLLKKLACGACRIEEKRKVLRDCGHVFCEDCAMRAMKRGSCWECGIRVVQQPTVVFL